MSTFAQFLAARYAGSSASYALALAGGREEAARRLRRADTLPDTFRKKCGACGVLKPRQGFHANASRTDGLAGTCRTCRAEQRR